MSWNVLVKDAVFLRGKKDYKLGRPRKPSKYCTCESKVILEDGMTDAEVDAYHKGYTSAQREAEK